MFKIFAFQRLSLWWKIFRMKAAEKRLFNLISKRDISELDKMFIDFCEKVQQYPEGSQGYKDLVNIHTDIVLNQVHLLDVQDRHDIELFVHSVICILSAKIIHLHVDYRKNWTTEVDKVLPIEIKTLLENASNTQYLVTMKICHDAILKFMMTQYMSYLLIQYGPSK